MNSKNYTKQLTIIKAEKTQGGKEAGQKGQVILSRVQLCDYACRM